jgi:hypothetical protein
MTYFSEQQVEILIDLATLNPAKISWSTKELEKLMNLAVDLYRVKRGETDVSHLMAEVSQH